VADEGEVLTPVLSGEQYLIQIKDIMAQDLDNDCVFKVINEKDENQYSVTLSYNPLSYCYNIVTSGEGKYSQEMKDLCLALCLYNYYAQCYEDILAGGNAA